MPNTSTTTSSHQQLESPSGDYLDPATTMTLRQGLAQMRGRIEGFIEGGKDYVDHDVLHVLYGLDTSLRSEGLLDALTIAGTDCSWKQYIQLVRRPESKQLLREIGYLRVFGLLFFSWPSMVAAFVRALRQDARWPYTNYDRYLDAPLADLRREFGIRV